MLKGELVSLYAIEESDLEQIRLWRNLESLRDYFREVYEIPLWKQKEWFKNSNSNPNEKYFIIKLNETNKALGVVGINYINWINAHCQLSLYIGVDELYIDDKGWALEAAQLIQKFAFNTLNLHKIFVEIFDFDRLKMKLLNDLGYLHEGTLKEHVFKKGKYNNSLIYSKLSDQ